MAKNLKKSEKKKIVKKILWYFTSIEQCLATFSVQNALTTMFLDFNFSKYQSILVFNKSCALQQFFMKEMCIEQKQAEVQQAETHLLYLCQFVIYGCVFINKFLHTDKTLSAYSYVLIKVHPPTLNIFTTKYLYALTNLHLEYILSHFCMHN